MRSGGGLQGTNSPLDMHATMAQYLERNLTATLRPESKLWLVCALPATETGDLICRDEYATCTLLSAGQQAVFLVHCVWKI